MKKLIIAILVLFIAVSAVSAADDVNQTDDVKTFADLQAKVDSASDNSTISLDANYTYNEGFAADGIKINKSLTINGNGHTLDANKSGRILNVTSPMLVLKNIRFINGFAESGGAIYFGKGNASIINCTFESNHAVNDGGAVYVCGDYDNMIPVSLTDSTFTGNYAGDDGSALYFQFGSEVSLINSTFISNHAEGCGSIYFDYGNYLNVFNSTFTSNSAGSGGAIYTCQADVSLASSTFTNNSVRRDGGAITLQTVEFPIDVSVTGCVFEGNSARHAGAVSVLFTVYADPGFVISDGRANFRNTVFKNNVAKTAGALYACANMDIYDSTFEDNRADYVGAIIFDAGENSIENCTFSNNSYGSILLDSYRDYTSDVYSGTLMINNRIYSGSISLNDDLKPVSLIEVKADKVTASYNSGKLFKVKLTYKNTKKPFDDVYLYLKIGSKTFDVYADSKGIVTFDTSKLAVGKYSVLIKCDEYAYVNAHSTITIKKAVAGVKAPKVTNKFKKSKYFKITVKSNKKPVKKLKLKIKVYTGKKFKNFYIKTDKNGLAKLNTKSLKVGKHRVEISSANKNYKVSAKSQIKIVK